MLVTSAATPLLQYTYGNDYEPVGLETFVITDIRGKQLTEIPKDSQVVLSATFSNNMNKDQTFFTVLEVRDYQGFTEVLQWQSSTVKPLDNAIAGFSWLPSAPGCYEARAFVISDLENPSALSLLYTLDIAAGITEEKSAKGQFQILQEGPASILHPESDEYGPSNYTAEMMISGTFEFQNRTIDFTANNLTLTVKSGDDIVYTQTSKPAITFDSYFGQLDFDSTTENNGASGVVYFDYSPAHAHCAQWEPIPARSHFYAYPEGEDLSIGDATGQIQFILDR